ncbi:hypothetical protein CDAR_566451 [Caerostris darwini]|uniref:Uncharacterized protein n=1 Tax=Caerostris darwini TaxID=1538125 RepID=A0AAV4X390_9ARAC|nr:hypothetical protein CDAR_566451 [Caerostris darwini]
MDFLGRLALAAATIKGTTSVSVSDMLGARWHKLLASVVALELYSFHMPFVLLASNKYFQLIILLFPFLPSTSRTTSPDISGHVC